MTPEEFRTAAHTLVDWIADYRAKVYAFYEVPRPVFDTEG